MNLGTALVSGVLSAEYFCDRAFRTLYGAIPGTYLLETDLKGGTFTIDWLLERWFERSVSTDRRPVLGALEAQAREIEPGASGLLLVPYWNGVMNPYWDDDATGIVVGLRGDHGPAHLYRAILEGLAFEQRLHTRAVEQSLGRPIEELVVMGGGTKSELFCQILADVLAKPLVLSGTAEATSLGAAMLAATGAGVFPSIGAALGAMVRFGHRFEPGPASASYDRLHGVYAGLYPALRASLEQLASIRKK
jgi:xylulokinase